MAAKRGDRSDSAVLLLVQLPAERTPAQATRLVRQVVKVAKIVNKRRATCAHPTGHTVLQQETSQEKRGIEGGSAGVRRPRNNKFSARSVVVVMS